MNSRFTYKYWCYDFSSGTVAHPNSVEVEVEAKDEERAYEKVKIMVKRDVYKLMTVQEA